MVKKYMYKNIQNYKKRGINKGEIALKMKIDTKTVAKYFDMNENEYKEYQGKLMFRDKVFDKYKTDIIEVYEKNEFKNINVSAIYDYLEEKHGKLSGSEKTLRNYIHYLVCTNELEFKENIRCYRKVSDLPFGQQMQLDFGQYKTKSGLLLYIFAAVLSASRYKYVAFQYIPFTTNAVILHLLDCFDYFQGIPEEMVIDQDKVMVVSENYGDIIYTKDFQYFLEEMELKMYVCRGADPESKGKIESVIKYIKRNFFATRNFTALGEAEVSVREWLSRRANGKISQATKQIPGRLINEEREKLRPIRNSIYRKDSLIGREERIVNENALFSVNASLYSVPTKYRNRTIDVYITNTKVFMFDPYTGKEIGEHTLSVIPGDKVKKREHYREKEKKSAELKNTVVEMFSLSNWKLFVEANFKKYPRYVRDQCIEAEKHFRKDIDLIILDGSLKFCLENKTYSFANLKDTYSYYSQMHRESKHYFCSVLAEREQLHKSEQKVRVKVRDLALYQSLINSPR
jgi:hypothetical protein